MLSEGALRGEVCENDDSLIGGKSVTWEASLSSGAGG
jgi:hypothetical protein